MTSLRKIASRRIVRELSKLSPDNALKKIRDKNLGKYVDNRTIKAVQGGSEGAVELRGHKNLGAVQTKFTDLNSPVASLQTSIDKVKINKRLANSPFAKNFTKHIKGSFGLSPDKSVVKTQSTWSPGMGQNNRFNFDAIKKMEDIQERAGKFLGTKLHDLSGNLGNFNQKRLQAIDFLPQSAKKGKLEIQTMARAALDPDKNSRLARGIKSRKDWANSPLLKSLEGRLSDKNIFPPKVLGDIRRGKHRPINAKGKPFEEFSQSLDDYQNMVGNTPPQKRLTDLKKKFYAKK